MFPLLRGLRDFLYPSVCMVCTADPADGDPFLCADCLAELWRPGTRYLDCTDVPFVSWMGFLGPYAGAVRSAVHEVKFGCRARFARHLGWLLARRLPHHVQPPHMLIPVPISSRVLARRGFNQAEEIALGIGRELGTPVVSELLVKRRETRPQRSLALPDRFANVQGSFALRSTAQLRNRRVGLVDDVTTTGATLAAAARLLRGFGAREVIALVIGRTPKASGGEG